MICDAFGYSKFNDISEFREMFVDEWLRPGPAGPAQPLARRANLNSHAVFNQNEDEFICRLGGLGKEQKLAEHCEYGPKVEAGGGESKFLL